MTWKIKAGWEHRAFLGVGPIADDEFVKKVAATALEQHWGADETAARSAYYEQVTEEAPHGR